MDAQVAEQLSVGLALDSSHLGSAVFAAEAELPSPVKLRVLARALRGRVFLFFAEGLRSYGFKLLDWHLSLD